MPDDSGVVEALRAQRPRRQAPTPRTTDRSPATPPQVLPPAKEAPRLADTSPPVSTLAEEETHAAPDKTGEQEELFSGAPLMASPDEPTVNFAVRIRRPFDDLLSRRIGQLRARGVRSSKVEITEMLLAELALDAPDALEQRLATFRRRAPR